jgi:hypothetical protein
MPEHIAASFKFLFAERAFAFYFLGSGKVADAPHGMFRSYVVREVLEKVVSVESTRI